MIGKWVTMEDIGFKRYGVFDMIVLRVVLHK